MKGFHLIVWVTQLGISTALPLTLCTVGSVWLRNRFGLGNWILFSGIGLGVFLAIDGFRTSLRAMERMGRGKKEDPSAPSVSFNDHQ